MNASADGEPVADSGAVIDPGDAGLLQAVSGLRVEPDDDPAILHQRIVDAAVRLLGADTGSLQAFDPDHGPDGALQLLAEHGLDARARQHLAWVDVADASVWGTALATRERQVVRDVHDCAALAGTTHREVMAASGIRAVQSTPLLARDGRVVGMLSTHWRAPHQPTARALQVLDILARQAADLLERERNEAERRQLVDDTRFMLDLTERLRQAGDARQALAATSQAVGDYLRAVRCYFIAFDEASDRWNVLHDYHIGVGPVGNVIAPEARQVSAIPEHLLAHLRSGRVLAANDSEHDPRFADRYAAIYRPLGIRSHAVVPLLRGGALIAGLVVASDAPRTWRTRELMLLETIADRAWNARERLQLAEEIARQRRLYEGILDNTPDLAYVFDRDHRFIYANRVLLEMWGKTWDEARGRTCLELGYEPWHAQMHDREIEQVVATRQPVRGVVPFTGTFGRRIYDYIFVPVIGRNGEVEAIAGTTRDITELKANEDALREADRRKDEFLATLAHELRNPLAPLRNCLQILRMDRAGTVDRAQLEGVMERQVDHLVHLVDDLLEVSRLTRGKVELRMERTALGRIIDNAVETSRPQLDAAGHRFEVDVADPLLVLEADPVRLCQVVANLLDNAARFTGEGGHVALSARREGDAVVVAVRDDGRGIAPEDLPRVFDLFMQGGGSRGTPDGGLGIGLTLVRTLVQLHGGTVEARSEGPGQGSEFIVRLPLPPVSVA